MRESVTIESIVTILAYILEIRPVERNGWIADIGWREANPVMNNVALRKSADLAASAIYVKAVGYEARSTALPRLGVVEVLRPRLHDITIQIKECGAPVVVERPALGAKKFSGDRRIITNPT